MSRRHEFAAGGPRIDPGDALLDEVARSTAAAGWLADQIGEMEPEHVLNDGTGRPSVLVDLWQKERKALVEASRAAMVAKVSEHRMQLDHQLAQIVVEGFRRLLASYDIPIDARAREVFAEVLGDMSTKWRVEPAVALTAGGKS